MKIGILTFQYAYNYGALLQAYGLLKFLEKLGHDVLFLNYIPKSNLPKKGFNRIKVFGREFKNQRSDILDHMIKRFQFDRFRNHFLPLTNLCLNDSDLSKVAETLDAVIVGSDQVWNGCFIPGAESYYLLDFAKGQNCKRISYAASFGAPLEKQTPELIKTAKKSLKEFDAISVRDEISEEAVRKMTNRQAEVVLDPTLLHSFEDISGYEGNWQEDYLGSYYISEKHSGTGVEILNCVQSNLKLPVKVIGNKMTNLKNYQKHIATGPLEWLRFFKGASFICADSFHATVFSVKLRKPFITWCGNRPDRAKSFLKICGLENRQISKFDPDLVDDLVNTPIDYDSVHERLENHIEKSKGFLKKALGAL